MPNKIFQHEIVLVFNSSFLAKIYAEKCNVGSSDIFIELEKIEEACWNGMLEEVLPEVFTLKSPDRPIYIWQIQEYNSVMEIDLAEFPLRKDEYLCIDPYKSMESRAYELNS